MKIVIESPVEHDGKLLDVGSEVDVPKEEAEALIACGAAKVLPAKAHKAKAHVEE